MIKSELIGTNTFFSKIYLLVIFFYFYFFIYFLLFFLLLYLVISIFSFLIENENISFINKGNFNISLPSEISSLNNILLIKFTGCSSCKELVDHALLFING